MRMRNRDSRPSGTFSPEIAYPKKKKYGKNEKKVKRCSLRRPRSIIVFFLALSLVIYPFPVILFVLWNYKFGVFSMAAVFILSIPYTFPPFSYSIIFNNGFYLRCFRICCDFLITPKETSSSLPPPPPRPPPDLLPTSPFFFFYIFQKKIIIFSYFFLIF